MFLSIHKQQKLNKSDLVRISVGRAALNIELRIEKYFIKYLRPFCSNVLNTVTETESLIHISAWLVVAREGKKSFLKRKSLQIVFRTSLSNKKRRPRVFVAFRKQIFIVYRHVLVGKRKIWYLSVVRYRLWFRFSFTISLQCVFENLWGETTWFCHILVADCQLKSIQTLC